MVSAVCKKNLIKISSLYFLKLRKIAGVEWTQAGEIAYAINTSRDALYVLLSRWVKWELVKRDKSVTPYRYALASAGQHYLNKLDKWYGPNEQVYQSVINDTKVSFYWTSLDSTKRITRINFIEYPFQDASDYSIVKPDPVTGRLIYKGDSLIRIKKANCLQAVYGIRDDLKLRWGDGLVNKLISEGFISRN